MGLDVYIEAADAPTSKVNPDHLFKVDYWRSSYNEGGINRILGNLGIPTLWDIAGVTEDMVSNAWDPDPSKEDDPRNGEIHLDWKRVRANADEAVILLRAAPDLGVMWEQPNDLRPQDGIIDTESKAMDYVIDQLAEHPHKKDDPMPFTSWTNAKGFFTHNPLAVKGIVRGKGFGGDGHYIVYEIDDGDEGRASYIESLEIVKESADWALSLDENPGVIWSH
jgi:hypothetical protein